MVCTTGWQRCGAVMVALVALLGATIVAAETAEELTDLSIEELLQVEITSVSKVVEPLFRAPAAIYVISNDDIRRSGATTLADALRMAPGVDVAHFDANRWAISVRGFNDVFANKLLVLIDGRSVYTPLFGGVFWDVQDTMLEDVDRIEIIRGPGGTLWGANAVNGVINITTKTARETQGLLATAGGGTEERGFGGLRYGGRYGEGLFYRVYAKYFDRSSFINPGPGDADDQWHAFRAGFRADWDLDPEDTLTFQGDIYDGRSGSRQTVSSPTAPFAQEDDDAQDVAGGNLIGRWNHRLSPSAQLGLKLYYDRTERDLAIVHETRDTFDVEAQHDFAIGPLPVVLLVALQRRSDGSLTSDVAAVVTKPLKPSQLFDALLGALGGKPAADRRPSRALPIERDLARRLPRRILIAEDNAVNQKVALRILQRMGYRADVAANGLEAVDAVRRQHYDIVFMDVQMPEMDGIEATRAIRALPPATQPWVVAMTAGAMREDREACLAAGMNDYVSKPVQVHELAAAIERTAAADAAPVLVG